MPAVYIIYTTVHTYCAGDQPYVTGKTCTPSTPVHCTEYALVQCNLVLEYLYKYSGVQMYKYDSFDMT